MDAETRANEEQLLALKRGVDGQPLPKNQRTGVNDSMPIESLLNPIPQIVKKSKKKLNRHKYKLLKKSHPKRKSLRVD